MIECVFPIALAVFLGLGIFTVHQIARLISEHLSTSTPLLEAGNFSSLLPAFGIATLTIVFGFGPPALQRVFRQGVSRNDSYGLMILVPISTILGIAAYRAIMTLAHHFDVAIQEKLLFLFFAGLIAFQGFVLWNGVAILRRNGAWNALSNTPPPAAFALICPGVAFVVALESFWGKGLALLQVPLVVLQGGCLATGLLQLYVAWILVRLVRRVIFTGAHPGTTEPA